MLIKDIMTKDVITIPSDYSIADAKRLMKEHRFRRLPVVDKGVLKGLVTEHRLEQVSPSKATSLTVWEIGYLLEKTKVKEIMERNLVTVPPDMEIERALAIAQEAGVGCLLVVDKFQKNKLVGIVTTNDFFYKIVNKVLGLGEPGIRILIKEAGEGKDLEKVISLANKHNLNIVTMLLIAPMHQVKHDVIIHFKEEDIRDYLNELKSLNYEVSIRNR